MPVPPLALTVVVETFPVLSQTFVSGEVAALRRLGHDVRVETRTRGRCGGEVEAHAMADDTTAARLRDVAWLAVRHPLGCARDLVARRRWRGEEHVVPLRALAPAARRIASAGSRHLHAHFATEPALDALRLGQVLGLPFSVTAHAYDIFLVPRNLREKLERAAFATSGCAVNVEHLRRLVAPRHARRIHEIVMGVDLDAFRREGPPAAGRRVLAIGRLVAKKGFGDLVEAAALLHERAPLDHVEIVGEGPLRGALEARTHALGLDEVVTFPGALDAPAVRGRLEAADVLAMPSVIGADGDRDSMPVVVKEALAMEVPVVTSDAVGLPELVRPAFGRMAPAGDAPALAEALAAVLAEPPERRAAMGRAGRAWVAEHANLESETARLAQLIHAAAAGA